MRYHSERWQSYGRLFRLPALPDRTLLAADPHRPRFHFSPPANWLNDPNGLIQWGETLHLFYQYNPQGPFHGTIHWGHASSTDLVHWQDHAIALAPTPGGPDQDGCWSGCAVDNNGTPTFVYTGVNPQTVCLATSADGLETWQKYGGNPVIQAPPAEVSAHDGGDFRDPYVWREADAWYMVIGSRHAGVGGLVLLYRSPDLAQWEFVRILLAGNERENTRFYEGAMWECPDLLDFGERRALIISAQDAHHRLHHAAYFSGVYRNHEFAPDTGGVLAYGHSFYAPQATRLADGRILLFGWLRETRTLDACKAAGWNGAMSLPLVATMRADGALQVAPAAELASLRREHLHIEELELKPEIDQPVALAGDALELLVTFAATPMPPPMAWPCAVRRTAPNRRASWCDRAWANSASSASAPDPKSCRPLKPPRWHSSQALQCSFMYLWMARCWRSLPTAGSIWRRGSIPSAPTAAA